MSIPTPKRPEDKGRITGLFAREALEHLLSFTDVRTVLDVGAGTGAHAEIMRKAGLTVTTLDVTHPADEQMHFFKYNKFHSFDAVWCSHVLEHSTSPITFLAKCRLHLRDGGVLLVTVPPAKYDLVGGHLSLWTTGLLCYNLIVAGWDCSEAQVSPCYPNNPGEPPYNLSVIVRNTPFKCPGLVYDNGDIEILKPYFPTYVFQGCDGRFPETRWKIKA